MKRYILTTFIIITAICNIYSQLSTEDPSFSRKKYDHLIGKYDIEKASRYTFKDYSEHNGYVNKTTGDFSYNVDLHKIKMHGIELPITIKYSSTNNRVDDISSVVGFGWELYAGGKITRKINGICDDFLNPENSIRYFAGFTPGDTSFGGSPVFDENGNWTSRKGYIGYMRDDWTYPSRRGNYSNYIFPLSTHIAINGYPPGDNIRATSTPLKAIAEIRDRGYDQPDVFRVQVGTLNFGFVFKQIKDKRDLKFTDEPFAAVELIDANGYKVDWEYGDIPIVYQELFSDNNGEPYLRAASQNLSVITKFIVTDNHGNKYHFENPEVIHKQYLEENVIYIDKPTLPNDRKINQTLFYDYTTTNWKIKKIELINGQNISFDYQVDNQINDQKIPRETYGEYLGYTYNLEPRKPYDQSLTKLPIEKKVYQLKTILTDYEEISFSYINSRPDFSEGGVQLESITIKNRTNNTVLKKINFEQSLISCNSNLIEGAISDPRNYRLYLDQINDSSKELNHTFSYIDRSNFPPRQSSKQDLFGFYGNPNASEFPFPKTYICPSLPIGERHRYYKPKNGITYYTINGDDRRPVPSLLSKGLLNQVTFPLKGKLQIEYEPNSFVDIHSLDIEVLGPGMRVNKLRYKDFNNTELKRISYNYDNQNQSSAKLAYYPQFSYVVNYAYDNEKNHATIRNLYPSSLEEGEGMVSYHYLKNNISASNSTIWKKLTKRSTVPYTPMFDAFGRSIIYDRIVEVNHDGTNGKVEYLNYPFSNDSKTRVTRLSGPTTDVNQPFPPPYGHNTAVRAPGNEYFPFTKNAEYGLVETEGYNIFPFPERDYYKNLNNLKTGQRREINLFNAENKLVQKTNYNYNVLKNEPPNVKGIRDDYFPTRLWKNNVNESSIPLFFIKYGGIYSFYEYLFSTDNELKMTTKTVTDYYKNGAITAVTNYEYENAFGLLRKIITTNSDEKISTQEYQYPHDINSGVYHTMANSKNQLATIIKTENKVNGDTQSYIKTEFKAFDLGKIQYLPASVSTLKKKYEEETRLWINRYNKDGNIIEYNNEHGIPTTLIWAYQGKHMIAKIEGMTFLEINQIMMQSEQIDLLEDVYDYYVTPTVKSVIEKIRSHSSAKAMVTTYTYQLPIGIKSITDPNGKVIQYYYDQYNRLSYIKDHNDDVLQKYEYNYKN